MIGKCTVKIADWLIRCQVITEEDRELYEYAIYSIFLTISPLFLAIVFGYLFGAVWQSVLIILPFVVIRKFSGGYHAKRAGTCLISSSLLLVLCIILSFCIRCNWILLIITILSAVSLMYFSPIESENRLLGREEQVNYKKTTAVIVVSFVIVDLFLFLFQMHLSVVCISIGLILSAGLQYPCILSKLIRSKRTKKALKMSFGTNRIEV